MRSRAFTLVEMLVVIGLIVLLLAFAIPMASRAHRASIRTAMAADLAIIANGLEAYKADFGDYPRRTVTDINGRPFMGAALLCWALVAPGPANGSTGIVGDGADGPGFRTRGSTGTVKGPYLPVDRFTIGEYKSPTVTPQLIANDALTMLGDRYSRPILYFAANKGVDPYSKSISGGAYLGGAFAMFNYGDNNEAPRAMSLLGIDLTPNKLSREVMCFRLGANGNSTPPDGNLNPTDNPLTTGPYLLWSPGIDGYFGSNDDVANAGSDLPLNTSGVPTTYGGTDPNPNLL